MTKYEALTKMLAFVVADGVYGPVDRMARAADLNSVRIALYEALRYVSTDIRKCIEAEQGERQLEEKDRKRCDVLKKLTGLAMPEDEIKAFLDEIEKRGVGVARRLAIETLTLGLKKGVIVG